MNRQHILDLHDELLIENFAGGGGASTGIFMAFNRHVDHAINHDPSALGMHRINHPQTVHHCEDVFDVDPRTVCEGRPVGLAWFSPDCKHFSKAKGGKPLSKKIRGLILVMLRWAKYKCRVMCMENVEEIQTWGPLIEIEKNGALGWYPDPEHKGRTWRAFLSCLSTGIAADHPDLSEILDVLDGTVTKDELIHGFGYAYEFNEIRAFKYGAPTIRNRLFMVARRDGRPIVWPVETHADPKTIHKGSKLKPWRTIAECLDWERPCPSIFLAGQPAREARCKRPLAPATLRRIAKGIQRYVMEAKEPFLVSLTHQGGDRIEATSRPVNTITGAHRGEKALVAPVITEHAQSHNQRNMPADEPLRTQCAGVKGGHFALVSGTLVQTGYGEREGQEPRALDPMKPLGTVVAGGAKHALAAATLVGCGGRAAQSRPRSPGEPLHTITSKADTCVVTGTLVNTCNGKFDSAPSRAIDPAAPLPTVTSAPKFGVAAASLIKMRGSNIGHGADEPLHTVSAGGTHHGVVAASVIRHFGESVGQVVDAPAPTVMAGGQGKTGLIAAYLAQHNGGFNDTPGRPATEPLSTVSAKGSQQQVVAASVAAYYGSETDGQSANEPMRTATTKARLGHVESTAVQPLTPEQRDGALTVAAFLRAHGVEFEGEYATVAGYVIVDIGMRMLTPRELFRAQGFPEDYVIDKAWLIDPQTGALREDALTKEQQIRMCGNSVSPPVAEAIVRANCPELILAPMKFKKPRRVALRA